MKGDRREGKSYLVGGTTELGVELGIAPQPSRSEPAHPGAPAR